MGHLRALEAGFVREYERLSGRSVRERSLAVAAVRLIYRVQRLLLMPVAANLAASWALLDEVAELLSELDCRPLMAESIRLSRPVGPSRLPVRLAGALWSVPARASAMASQLLALLIGAGALVLRRAVGAEDRVAILMG